MSSKEEMSRLAAELYAVVCVECCDAPINLGAVIDNLVMDSNNTVCTIVP